MFCQSPDCLATGGEREAAVFSPVPKNLRPQLIRRLNLYVRLRSTRQWARLYDMYSRRYLARRWPPTGMSRAEFAEGNKQDDAAGRGDYLLRFKASRVRFIPETEDRPTTVVVEGCAEYYASRAGKRVGRSRRVKSVVEAMYEGKEWYLTDVVTDYECEGCEAKKCRMN